MYRKTRILGGLLAVLILLALVIQPVLAQTYRFSVPVSSADVYVNQDGSVTIDYYYLFENDSSADPIDFVDVGMPTNNYNMGSITATINGQPVADIEASPYVDPGIAIDLGANDIQPGERGELIVHIERVERILFKASEQEAEPYASFQFQPNFFGSEFVRGRTDMTVTLILPPGLEPEEPRYFTPQGWPGSDEPESGYDDQDRVYYSWNTPNADSSDRYTFGASFPQRVVPDAELLTEVPFDFSEVIGALCPMIFCVGLVGFIGFSVWAGIQGDKKRRMQYLPPKASVEGNGIKRGLTPVEAAILMGQPMDKILTMILFSVIKKEAATVVSREPMKLDVTVPRPEGLRSYETDFLEAMALPNLREQRAGLQATMTNLVKGVTEKIRGFSRKETVAYYQDIMNKAWAQVEQADTPEMRMKTFDDAMDWTMLDRRFEDRSREVLGPRPIIVPTWWGRYDPTFNRPTTASMGAPSMPSGPTSQGNVPQGVNLPSLPGADFAASMVGGMQSFSSDVVGNLTTFTGGVTERTNPVPKPPPSRGGGRGGGGGRSCACACACAGCACACAGGGR